jgi:hypothetical protein
MAQTAPGITTALTARTSAKISLFGKPSQHEAARKTWRGHDGGAYGFLSLAAAELIASCPFCGGRGRFA